MLPRWIDVARRGCQWGLSPQGSEETIIKCEIRFVMVAIKCKKDGFTLLIKCKSHDIICAIQGEYHDKTQDRERFGAVL